MQHIKKKIFQIFKYMTCLSKNVYIDKLTQLVKELNNTIHRTIIIRSVDVKPDTCIDLDVEINTKNQKVKIGEHERISKYKNTFLKGYKPNWSE